MKNVIANTCITVLLVFICFSGFSQPSEWKHYEYKDINLKFDLPVDFVFEYPADGGLSFIGYNKLITLNFKRVDKPIVSFEQRKAEFYLQAGYKGDYSGDVNFMSGTSRQGYLYVATASNDEATHEDFLFMMLSDPKDNTLNFQIAITYGGEENTNTMAYEQAIQLVSSFSPIVK